MKLLKNIAIWVVLFVVFQFIFTYQARLIDDPVLNYTAYIIEFIILCVLAVRAKARIKARRALENSQSA